MHWLEMDERAKQAAIEEAERELAYAEVNRALAAYRWWRFDNIVMRLRMALTWCRIKLGMRLYP